MKVTLRCEESTRNQALGKHLFGFYHVADSISMRVLTVFYIRCEIEYILVCLPRPFHLICIFINLNFGDRNT